MSRENVRIVRATLDAISRGDLDWAFAQMAPDAVLDHSRAIGMDRGVFTPEQFRAVAAEFASGWESVSYQADEFIEAGEHVVTPFTNRLLGRDGIELQARGAWVWTVHGGVVVRVCLYQERGEALEAVGLRE
jgi:ketosteroid isomerase-like protein